MRIPAIVLLAALLALGCPRPGPEIAVTFSDASALSPGDPLIHHEEKIGTISRIRRGDGGRDRVAIRLHASAAGRVYREAEFSIARDEDGDGMVVMRDRGSRQTPVAGGDELRGSDGLLDRLAGQARAAGEAAAAAIDRLLGSAERAVEEAPDSPAARELQRSLREFAREAERAGRDTYDELARERLPELEAKARRVREELERSGAREKATRFWRRFERFLDDAREQATRGQPEATPATPPLTQPTPAP